MHNGYVKAVTLSTPEEMKDNIEDIINQLQKYKYAFARDSDSVRLFSRLVAKQRQKGSIIISTPCSVEKRRKRDKVEQMERKITNVISISPSFDMERRDSYTFRLIKL